MKRIEIILAWVICTALSMPLYTQSAEPSQLEEHAPFGLSAIMGYNFHGNSDWSNFTPEVFLGWTSTFYENNAKSLSVKMRVGPTVSTIKSSTDTSDYYRSIMLPGNASFSLLPYLEYDVNPDLSVMITGGLGAKVLAGLTDTSASITQSNIRLGAGFQFKNLLAVSVQHTWGNHTLTAESEAEYKSIFQQNNTNVQYLSVNIQTLLPEMNLYLFINYRKFLSTIKGDFFDNDRIVSIGLRKEIDILGGFSAE